jgi:hypothetical protein
MAKRADKEETTERFPTAAQYGKYRKAYGAAKAEMDEAKGEMGEAKLRAVADLNLHADADRIVAKYANKSPAQQREFIMHFDTYWSYLGLATEEDDLFAEQEAPAKAAEPAEPLEPPRAAKPKGRKKAAQVAPEAAPEAIEGNHDGRTRAMMPDPGSGTGGGPAGGNIVSLAGLVADKAS